MQIFCSGIGGIGLSAYAALRRLEGHDVRGTDRSDSALLDDLRAQGIEISLDQSGAQVPENCDLFVYSEAIPATAPERMRATELGIRQISYPHALGELSKGSFVIAVCGTHGKSSTTAMAARMLIETGRDPTVVVGTKLKELNGRNWRKGKSNVFLLEACEYRGSFHFYDPTVILMTNCDGDHFDCYASVEEYQEAFKKFISTLPPDGVVITHGGDADARHVALSTGKRMIDADTQPLITLQTPGLHMQQNAQLALSLAAHLEIPQEEAKKSVSGYAGSWRRLENKGTHTSGALVIDDYAHHPTEIKATLAAIRGQYGDQRIICAFQPHTHDRTLKLYDQFLNAFKDVDIVIIPNVYEARKDIETGKVDLPIFLKDIAKKSDVEVFDGKSLAETETMLHDMLKSDDVLVCMGAGDITSVAGKMVG